MSQHCFLSEKEADIQTLPKHDGCTVRGELGKYWISGEAIKCYSGSNQLPEIAKLNALQETILLNRENLIPFWTVQKTGENVDNHPNVVLRSLEEMKNKQIDHKDKEKKILDALSKKISAAVNPFSFTHLDTADMYAIGVFKNEEYVEWIKYLYKKNLIDLSNQGKSFIEISPKMESELIQVLTKTDSIKITVQGWEYVRTQNSGINSRNVFIAMAFTDREGVLVSKDLVERIKSTLEKLNWNPIIVNEVEHNDGIMDKVIASINDSRFVIAELTYQKSGVYYEAGYAKGKQLPVIHIVGKADLEKCHFDVKHLNLIVWENLEDLEKKLESRIKATIV